MKTPVRRIAVSVLTGRDIGRRPCWCWHGRRDAVHDAEPRATVSTVRERVAERRLAGSKISSRQAAQVPRRPQMPVCTSPPSLARIRKPGAGSNVSPETERSSASMRASGGHSCTSRATKSRSTWPAPAAGSVHLLRRYARHPTGHNHAPDATPSAESRHPAPGHARESIQRSREQASWINLPQVQLSRLLPAGSQTGLRNDLSLLPSRNGSENLRKLTILGAALLAAACAPVQQNPRPWNHPWFSRHRRSDSTDWPPCPAGARARRHPHAVRYRSISATEIEGLRYFFYEPGRQRNVVGSRS